MSSLTLSTTDFINLYKLSTEEVFEHPKHNNISQKLLLSDQKYANDFLLHRE